MLWTLIRLDARQLVRERLAVAVLLIGAMCSGLAAWQGAAWIDRLAVERAAFLSDAAEEVDKTSAEATSADTTEEQRATLPVRVTRPVAFPVPTLADFSVGRSDIEPSTATLRMRYRSDTLFRVYQIDNPERLARGRFDLGFVAVVIVPLLLIALGYGVFAADRERGTARLILSQAGSPTALLAARSVNRLAIIFAPLLAAGLVLLLVGPDFPHRAAAAALWLTVAALGLLFWWAVILFVNALRVTAESAALALVGLWALLVFVAPAAINAGAQALHPPPSRLAQIVDARSAELRATAVYENDHAALGEPGPAQLRETVARNYRIGLAVEEEVSPRIAAFDAQLARQQAVAQRAQLLSPPMIVASALASIAGTDEAAYSQLRKESRAALASFKASLGRSIANERFNERSNAQLRSFLPVSAASSIPTAAIWLLLAALLLSAFAVTRLSSIEN